MNNQEDYIICLEDAILAIWHELPSELAHAIDKEKPGLMEFCANLHAKIEHVDRPRQNEWEIGGR